MHRGVSRSIRPNGSIRGRGHVMKDARFKIIEKNREKLTDARDKLAEIAKQSDARLKLDKIRASQHKKINAQFPKLSRNDRLALSTNKAPPLMSHTFPSNMSNNYMQPSSRATGYRPPPPPISESHYLADRNMDYATDGMVVNRSDM